MRAKKANPPRDRIGRFDFSNLSLPCECGHTLGQHAAKNDTRLRPCFADDMKDGQVVVDFAGKGFRMVSGFVRPLTRRQRGGRS